MLDVLGTQQHRSFTSMVVLVAGIAIVFAALHLAAEVVTPILLAMVVALIFWPVYTWLRGKGMGTLPALVVLLVGLVVGVGLVVAVILYSINGLADRLVVYADNLSARAQSFDAFMGSLGLTDSNLANLLSPDRISGAFGAFASVLTGAIYQGLVITLLLLFFLVEGPAIAERVRLSLDETDPNPARLRAFGRDVAQYFILRAGVNAVTGVGVTLVLWLLGIDFPLLWGVLTFFLSFIPYVGMFLASVPSVLLAWAEYDLAHAVITALALTVVNAVAENLVQPALMHKGLGLSPTFVFISVFFWGWLLSGGGSFLAVPLSLGLIAVLANFPAANWFVNAVTSKSDAPAVVEPPPAPPPE